MAEEKLTYQEAADFLGIALRTFYNKVRVGVIPKHVAPVGVGRGGQRTYFLRSELEAIKAQMIGAPDTTRHPETPRAKDRAATPARRRKGK